MKLTSKGRYAVTAMLDVALHFQQGPVSLAEIAERQEISLSYLEQLFAKLRKNGLVKSVRGPGGGYLLGKSIEETTISDIIGAVDESIDPRKCKGDCNCRNGARCLAHYLWHELSQNIDSFLKQISLASLVQNKEMLLYAKQSGLLKEHVIEHVYL